jgi:hypothetical protein
MWDCRRTCTGPSGVGTVVSVVEVEEVEEVDEGSVPCGPAGEVAVLAVVVGESRSVVVRLSEAGYVADCELGLPPPSIVAPTMARAKTAATVTAIHFFLVMSCSLPPLAPAMLDPGQPPPGILDQPGTVGQPVWYARSVAGSKRAKE